mgnify:CR=1 FL=1
MRLRSAYALVAFTVLFPSLAALAEGKPRRAPEECAAAWGKAVRSYGKPASVPTPDDNVFKAACELEGKGDRAASRVEAVKVAVQALAKQDGDGCVRFLTSYIAAKEPQTVCDLGGGDSEEALMKSITENLPAPPSGKSKSK